jgi:hypothetical protein
MHPGIDVVKKPGAAPVVLLPRARNEAGDFFCSKTCLRGHSRTATKAGGASAGVRSMLAMHCAAHVRAFSHAHNVSVSSSSSIPL